MPISNPGGPTVLVATGIYTGDDTVNRAIPHTLGQTPKLILIAWAVGTMIYRIHVGLNSVIYMSPTLSGVLAVTAPNSTNFYVGNATNYNNSANMATRPYRWFAIY